MLDRVRRQTRTEVAEGRSRSLNACPPDFHDNPPSDDDATGFSNHTHVPGHGDNAEGFSSSQEVSDYLPQPYRDAALDVMDDLYNYPEADKDEEKTADFMDVRGVA